MSKAITDRITNLQPNEPAFFTAGGVLEIMVQRRLKTYRVTLRNLTQQPPTNEHHIVRTPAEALAFIPLGAKTTAETLEARAGGRPLASLGGSYTTRGGARPGAGRKSIGPTKMVMCGLRVPPDVASATKADPEGARAALVRWATKQKPAEN